jgi:hypothetical protein
MALNCTLNDLLTASKCFRGNCMSADEREAIIIYLRAQNLNAKGGADLRDITTLQTAAKSWQTISKEERQAIEVFIEVTNATAAGATVSATAEGLKAAAKCFMCLGEERRKQLLAFLLCAISSAGGPI